MTRITLAAALSLATAAIFGAMAFVPATAHAAPAKETLPSGVVIETVKAGTGATPKATDTVVVNYRGVLANGAEFDSSYKRGVPATFPLNRVVPCWTQGIQHVKVGGKAKLTCPADTAYGPNGIPGVIPPNATLTFDVEVLAVQ